MNIEDQKAAVMKHLQGLTKDELFYFGSEFYDRRYRVPFYLVDKHFYILNTMIFLFGDANAINAYIDTAEPGYKMQGYEKPLERESRRPAPDTDGERSTETGL